MLNADFFAVRCAALPLLLLLLVAGRLPAADPAPDFASKGRPFLEKYCLKCHRGAEPMAELSLEPFRDAASLVRARKTWTNVLKLVVAGEMPPSDQTQPSVAEVEALTDLVKAVFDHADRHAKPDPGRVTMRRLNRVEYRNTIRDLIGVDFDPTEDFPSDDIGHGFDNIGDVLTLSPVLMERYLDAAESIMQRAIMPIPPPVPQRWLGSQYTEPASGEVEKRVMAHGYRRVDSAGQEAIEVGPLHTPYEWAADGSYIFRTQVYAEWAPAPEPPAPTAPAPTAEDGKKAGEAEKAPAPAPAAAPAPPSPTGPIRLAILVHGRDLPDPSSEAELERIVGQIRKPAKILQIVEVTARERGKPQVVEVRVPPMPGRERMMVGLVKPTAEHPAARLFVNYMYLEGPLDTRPATQKRLLAVAPERPPTEQTREVLARFLRRAFRQPPTADELNRAVGLVEGVTASGGKWEAGMQLAMQAALCHPKFLFRVELDDRPNAADIRPLDDYQLASRLAYFLWSSMPDDPLLDLAAAGQLSGQLDAQVRRMLADPKSAALVQSFALQWLQIQRIEFLSPDGKLFPSFSNHLRQAMLRETELFVESVFREDRSVLDLIDADYTFLNEPLARHYGIADTAGNWMGQKPTRPGGVPIRGWEFRRVTLPDRTRGGLLTQASVLTVTSNPTRTSPVKRGRWVLEQILGAPPPPPPPNVPELPSEEKDITAASLRQRLEVHRQQAACASCHAKMDPIGFALENYNAIGAFRTKDGAFDIDASGEFADGTKFAGPGDLKAIVLARKEEFSRCLTEKLLTYALGRGLEYYDRPVVEKIVQTLPAHSYRFSVLVAEIAKSDAFRQRRGPNPLQ